MAYPIRRGYFAEMLFPTWNTSIQSQRWISSYRRPTSKHTRNTEAMERVRAMQSVWRTKNCAISHPRPNERVGIREYSPSGQVSHERGNDQPWPEGEYSRMPTLSLGRGCEIAQFFVRYIGCSAHGPMNTFFVQYGPTHSYPSAQRDLRSGLRRRGLRRSGLR